MRACENRFGADRTIFLTNNAGFVHRPWQTAAPIHKCGPDSDGPSIQKLFDSPAFIYTDWPDGRGWTNISTGNTVNLTAAGANPKIKYRCPQALQATFENVRMNHIGGTNPQALPAFDTAPEERFFIQKNNGGSSPGILL